MLPHQAVFMRSFLQLVSIPSQLDLPELQYLAEPDFVSLSLLFRHNSLDPMKGIVLAGGAGTRLSHYKGRK